MLTRSTHLAGDTVAGVAASGGISMPESLGESDETRLIEARTFQLRTLVRRERGKITKERCGGVVVGRGAHARI